MKPEAQLVAIAESEGWDCDPREARGWRSRGQWVIPPGGKSLIPKRAIPYYPNDLNAMHKVEGAMLFSKRRAYKKQLQRVMTPKEAPDNGAMVSACETCFATAAQRAEAYLRTINKWSDEQ